jgi:hypothetical protein
MVPHVTFLFDECFFFHPSVISCFTVSHACNGGPRVYLFGCAFVESLNVRFIKGEGYNLPGR